MALNRGKEFEQQFRADWINTFGKNTVCERLPDQQSGYYGTSRNICDFICYKYPNIFFIECKSIQGNTFPLTNLKQYAKLIKFVGIEGVRCGVVLWFVDHKKVFYVPVSTFTKLQKDGKKSFNVKDEGSEDYFSVLLPSQEKRVFLQTDYSELINLKDGE